MNKTVEELLTVAPDVAPRWEEHLEFWDGEVAGDFNDIAVFAHHVVDSYAAGTAESIPGIFTVVEQHLANADQKTRELLVVGFLEDVQNIASHRPFGYSVFAEFLGPLSRSAWREIEIIWQGKTSLAGVIRSERKQ